MLAEYVVFDCSWLLVVVINQQDRRAAGLIKVSTEGQSVARDNRLPIALPG